MQVFVNGKWQGGGNGWATDGNTIPIMWDPYAPPGVNPFTELLDAQIWRLYHSAMLLLPSGEFWVSGSEPNIEYRGQIYTPPYLLTGNPRPLINYTSVPTSVGHAVARLSASS